MLVKFKSHSLRKALSMLVLVGGIAFQIVSNSAFSEEKALNQNQFITQVFGSGKPVMLIPGLMSDGSVWQQLVSALSNKYQVHTVSVVGFAGTPSIDNPSMDELKQQLIDYIEVNNLQKPAVIGHSLGGFLGFWLAASHPSKIGPVISVDGLPFVGPVFTGSNASTVESMAAQAQQMKTMYSRMSQQQLVEQAKYGLSIQASSDAAKAKVMSMVQTSDVNTVGQAIYHLMSHDLRADIAKIKSPVLLLGASGGFSTDTQKSAMQQLYKQQLAALPKAQLIMNTQSRHFIMFDDPLWLNQQVTSFLSENL